MSLYPSLEDLKVDKFIQVWLLCVVIVIRKAVSNISMYNLLHFNLKKKEKKNVVHLCCRRRTLLLPVHPKPHPWHSLIPPTINLAPPIVGQMWRKLEQVRLFNI